MVIRSPETPALPNAVILAKTSSEIVKKRCGDYQHPRHGCRSSIEWARRRKPRHKKGKTCAVQSGSIAWRIGRGWSAQGGNRVGGGAALPADERIGARAGDG